MLIIKKTGLVSSCEYKLALLEFLILKDKISRKFN